MKIGVKMMMSDVVEGWDVVGRCGGVYYVLDTSGRQNGRADAARCALRHDATRGMTQLLMLR